MGPSQASITSGVALGGVVAGMRETLEALHEDDTGASLVRELSDVTFLDSASLGEIMAARRRKSDVLTREVGRLLGPGDGGRRLEGHPEDHRFPVADAALHPAAVVGGRAEGPAARDEGVVVLAAGHEGSGEAGSDLEALGGRQRHHRPGQLGFELVEDGLAQPGGLRFDSEDGSQISVLLDRGPGEAEMQRLDFFHPRAAGTSDADFGTIQEWLGRLKLRFDASGELVPASEGRARNGLSESPGAG